MLTNHKENLISIAKVNDKAATTTVVDCPTQPNEKYERTQKGNLDHPEGLVPLI